MAVIPSWSNLPTDIWLEIFLLLEFLDLIRVSAVCTSFRRVVSHSPKLHPLWLMFYPSKTKEEDQIITKYCSLSENRVYDIPFEKLFSNWNVIGSSHGWLIMADNKSDLHLCNPLNGRHILLPPAITMDDINPIIDGEGNITQYEATMFGVTDVEKLHLQFTKIALSCDPGEGRYIVVLVHMAEDQSEFRTKARISFVREGDEQWNVLDEEMLFYLDLVFHNELLYGVTEIGGIDVWDFSTSQLPSLQTIVSEIAICGDDYSNKDLIENALTDKYIMRAPWGDILVVWRKFIDVFEGKNLYQETSQIDIYKVDFSNESLVKVHALGDYVLFLGETSGCFSTESSSNLRGNCVYFKEYCHADRTKHLCLYDLENHQFEFDVYSALSSYTPITWITPNCVRNNTI